MGNRELPAPPPLSDRSVSPPPHRSHSDPAVRPLGGLSVLRGHRASRAGGPVLRSPRLLFPRRRVLAARVALGAQRCPSRWVYTQEHSDGCPRPGRKLGSGQTLGGPAPGCGGHPHVGKGPLVTGRGQGGSHRAEAPRRDPDGREGESAPAPAPAPLRSWVPPPLLGPSRREASWPAGRSPVSGLQTRAGLGRWLPWAPSTT